MKKEFNLLHQNNDNIIKNLTKSGKISFNTLQELREACNYEIYRNSMIDAIDNNTKIQKHRKQPAIAGIKNKKTNVIAPNRFIFTYKP